MSQQTVVPPADDLDAMERRFAARWRWVLVILLALFGLAVGVAVSRAAAPAPKIGIVRLYDYIDYETAPYYFGPLQAAAERRDIAAVVILVDSGGGYATISEELFYTIAALRDEKPVVASIEGIGASVAYYAASAANYIIARPAADVGSIGVITGGLPEDEPPDEDSYATGPFKGQGASRTDYIRDIELIKQVFLSHVYDQRVHALETMHDPSRVDVLPPREMLATGQLWIGTRAFQIGLIDAVGSNDDAIKKAAELAGISNYDVVDLLAAYLDEPEQYEGYSAFPHSENGQTTQYVSPIDRIFRLFYQDSPRR
jgi:protease IV